MSGALRERIAGSMDRPVWIGQTLKLAGKLPP